MVSKREEHIEHQVRKRLAEALGSAGVDFNRISLEVLYLLPPQFLDAYIELYLRALKDESSGGIADENTLLGVGKKTKRYQIGPATNNSGKKYRDHWQIRDDAAFALKKRIDRKLLKLVAEMRTGKGADEGERARCGECGRWMQSSWRYCGWCGTKPRKAGK